MLFRWINRARCIVENEHPRVRDNCSCNRNPLPLSTRERVATLTEQRVVSIWKFLDKRCSSGKLRRVANSTKLCLKIHRRHRERDVGGDGVVKEQGVFEDNADRSAQIVNPQRSKIDAIERHRAVFRVVEPQQQSRHRRFS